MVPRAHVMVPSWAPCSSINIIGRLKKTGPCFISLYLWQFITVWTGNALMVHCKLSLSSDMLVKAYSKPRVYYQSIRL